MGIHSLHGLIRLATSYTCLPSLLRRQTSTGCRAILLRHVWQWRIHLANTHTPIGSWHVRVHKAHSSPGLRLDLGLPTSFHIPHHISQWLSHVEVITCDNMCTITHTYAHQRQSPREGCFWKIAAGQPKLLKDRVPAASLQLCLPYPSHSFSSCHTDLSMMSKEHKGTMRNPRWRKTHHTCQACC